MAESVLHHLKNMFGHYDLWPIAQNFYRDYPLALDGLFPKIRFENDELPDKNNFLTLVNVCSDFAASPNGTSEGSLSSIEIRKLLGIPFSKIQDVISQISHELDLSDQEVREWYGKDYRMYFVSLETVRCLGHFLSGIFDQSTYRVFFRDALLIGYEETKNRINAVLQATGPYAQEVFVAMYGNDPNGHLFCPASRKPVAAIEFLMEQFDQETIACILKSEYWFLYAFGCDDDYVGNTVETYLKQNAYADELKALFDQITQFDYDEQWVGDFLPLFEKVKLSTLQNSSIPRLARNLRIVITAFKQCGMPVPMAYEQYCKKDIRL